jgi:hypothetical protein
MIFGVHPGLATSATGAVYSMRSDPYPPQCVDRDWLLVGELPMALEVVHPVSPVTPVTN